MNRLALRLTHVAMLFCLLGPASAVSGAEPGVFSPAVARWTDAQFLNAATQDDAEDAPKPAYGWKTPPPDTPDWKGVGRDTVYFVAYQLLIVGLLYVAPESISGWSKEQKENPDWVENVSSAHRDTDDDYINYLLHPYWGATYYIRGRERGLDGTQSFLFSVGLSTLYEYGVEAIFEKPSYQDLWATPVLGSLLGEFVFSPIREHIRAKPGDLDWTDKTIMFLTDPLGVLNAGPDRLLGVQTTFRLQAFQTGLSTRSSPYSAGASNSPADGVLRNATPGWGVQLQVRW